MSARLLLIQADPELARRELEGTGFQVVESMPGVVDRDLAVVLPWPSAPWLRAADGAGLPYTLVHVGEDDREPGGSFERAHHRIQPGELAALAARLKGGERTRVEIVAFGYRNGLPAAADWVVDARFLANPYWEEELRELDGFDERVKAFVLGQPAAIRLLDSLEGSLTELLGAYGRAVVTIAVGCTGGRHRSVAMAAELARRLGRVAQLEVGMTARDL